MSAAGPRPPIGPTPEEIERRKKLQAGEAVTPAKPNSQKTEDELKEDADRESAERAKYLTTYEAGLNSEQKMRAAGHLSRMEAAQRLQLVNSTFFSSIFATDGWIRGAFVQAISQPEQLGGYLLGVLFKRLIQKIGLSKMESLANAVSRDTSGMKSGDGADSKFKADTQVDDPSYEINFGKVEEDEADKIKGHATTFWDTVRGGIPTSAPALVALEGAKAPRALTDPERDFVTKQRIAAMKAMDPRAIVLDNNGNPVKASEGPAEKRVQAFLEKFGKELSGQAGRKLHQAYKATGGAESFEVFKQRMARAVMADLGLDDRDARLLLDDKELERRADIQLVVVPLSPAVEAAAAAAANPPGAVPPDKIKREAAIGRLGGGPQGDLHAHWTGQIRNAHAGGNPGDANRYDNAINELKNPRLLDLPTSARQTLMFSMVDAYSKTHGKCDTLSEKLAFFKAVQDKNIMFDPAAIDSLKQAAIQDEVKKKPGAMQFQVRVSAAETARHQAALLAHRADSNAAGSPPVPPRNRTVNLFAAPTVADPGLTYERAVDPENQRTIQAYFTAAKAELTRLSEPPDVAIISQKDAREAYYALVAEHNRLMDARFDVAEQAVLNANPPGATPARTHGPMPATMTYQEFKKLSAQVTDEETKKKFLCDGDKKAMEGLRASLTAGASARQAVDAFIKKHLTPPAPAAAPAGTPVPGGPAIGALADEQQRALRQQQQLVAAQGGNVTP